MDYVVIAVLNEESTLYVPNAFTPNGDSINVTCNQPTEKSNFNFRHKTSFRPH